MNSPSGSGSSSERIDHLLTMGLDYFGINRVDDAVAAWEEVLQFDPQNQKALDYLGIAKNSEPDREEPDNISEKVVDFRSKKRQMGSNREATSEGRRKKPLVDRPFAPNQGKRSKEQNPDTPQVDGYDEVFKRGMRAYLQRDYSAAIVNFEKCLSLRPNDARVRHNLRLLVKKRANPS